jgi:hypothetical protein
MVVAGPQIRSITDIHRVAIIDDNLDDADAMSELVRDAGFEPIVIRHPFSAISGLGSNVRQQAEAVICDHRLRNFAPFMGAEAVANLVSQKIPALLITQYIDIDADVTIRQWRAGVPVLLSRDKVSPEGITEGLARCLREIQGEYLPGRRPRRVLIQIDSISQEGNAGVIDAWIPSWNPRRMVRFPVELVPPELQHLVVPNAFLIAKVNIGAEEAADLYFRDFEPAPDPAPEESLG